MGRIAPVKDAEKKGQSACHPKHGGDLRLHQQHAQAIRGMESKKYDPWALKEIWIFIIMIMHRLLYPDISIP